MTRDELTRYVLDRTMVSGSDTARVSVIVAMLKQAHARVVTDLALKQVVSDIALVAVGGDPNDPAFVSGGATVSLPSDCARVRAVLMSGHPITEVSWLTLMEYVTAPLGAAPAYAHQGADMLRIYPAPDDHSITTVALAYDARPTEMVAGTDEPDAIPTGYHEVLAELVVHRVLLGEEEPGLAALAKQTADEMMARLMLLRSTRGGQLPSQLRVPGLRPNRRR